MFSNQEIIQPHNRESNHSFNYKLMISFLVIQYSMDEKNDKQGGAFSRESEIYQRSGQKRHLGEFLFTTGAAVLPMFSL